MDKLEDLKHQFGRRTIHLRLARRNLELAEASVKANLHDVQSLGREILKLEKEAKDELL